MNGRAHILNGLVQANLIGDFKDSCQVANALVRGESRDFILTEMPELQRWPKALAFLSDRL